MLQGKPWIVKRARSCLSQACAALLFVSLPGAAGDRNELPNMTPFRNADGFAATYSTDGSIDLTNPFFQSLGTNGRACVTCHQPDDGWTVTPAHLRERFNASRGMDP